MNRMIALLFCLALVVAIGCKEKAAPAPAAPAGGAPSSTADAP